MVEHTNENIDEKILLSLPDFLGGKPFVCISGEELERLISQPHIQVINIPVIVEIQTEKGPKLKKLYVETLLELPRGSLFAKSEDLGWQSKSRPDVVIGIDPSQNYYIDSKDHKRLTQKPPSEDNSLSRYITEAPRIEARTAATAALAAQKQAAQPPKKPEIETLSLSPEKRELGMIAEGAKTAQIMSLPSRFCLVSGDHHQLTITKPPTLTMQEWQEEIKHRVQKDRKTYNLLQQIITSIRPTYQVDERWIRTLLAMLDMNRSQVSLDIANQIIGQFTPMRSKQISFGFSYSTRQNPSPFDEGLQIGMLSL